MANIQPAHPIQQSGESLNESHPDAEVPIVSNDNITIIVPNSDFITQRVTNWSYGDSMVRIRLLPEVAANHLKVLKEPESQVFFSGFGDNSLNFELGVWTS